MWRKHAETANKYNRNPADTLATKGRFMSDAADRSGTDLDGGAQAIFGLLSEDLNIKDVEEVPEEPEDSEEVDDADAESDVDADDADESDDDSDDDQEEVEGDDDADEDTDSDTPPTYKVKVDGQEVEVSLQEALAGYQRQQTWTKRMQAVAEERRAVQEDRAGITQKQQEYLDRLAVVDNALKGSTPQEPNWEQLKKDNPVQYAEMRAAFQQRKEQIEAIEAEQLRVRNDMQATFNAERDRILTEEAERLDAAIPEWGTDPDVAKAEKLRIAEYAMNTYGFAPKDLEQVVDHRVVLMLRDAMRYNELQTKGKDAQEAARKNRRKGVTLQPGTAAKRGGKKSKGNPARERLRQSGSVHDAAAAFFDLLGNE
jgi:hypothetical protein